jgi:hypothetical protein
MFMAEAAIDELIDSVVATDFSELPEAAQREEFVAWRRRVDRLESYLSRALSSLHRSGAPAADGATSTPTWVRMQTGQSWKDAKASLDAGLACESLPLTAKAWAQGEISASSARVICAGRPDGHEAAFAEVEETLVDFAAAHDARGLGAAIAYVRQCADALDDVEPSDRNGLHLSKTIDRWVISGDLDDLAGTTVHDALNAATDRPTDDDTRMPSKRRADAFVRICRFFLDHEALPIEGGEVPHVSIVSYSDAIRDHLPSATGIGPSLSASQLGEVLCDSTVSRILLGADGRPLDVGREHRTAPRWLRRAIAFRDGGCRFPGCGRQPSWCHAHHVDPWENGGVTSAANLVLLCAYHHGLVHKRGWHDSFDGFTYRVTNPDGKRMSSTQARARTDRARL